MLVQGATWPVDAAGQRKKIPDFTGAELKLLVCQFERRGKGVCTRGAECAYSHDVPKEGGQGQQREASTQLIGAVRCACVSSGCVLKRGPVYVGCKVRL